MKEHFKDEDGFTLIELLVVILIIGILSAIAIPAFLSQRSRAWDSAAESAARNVALAINAETTARGGKAPEDTDAIKNSVPANNALGSEIAKAFKSEDVSVTYTKQADLGEFKVCAASRLYDKPKIYVYDSKNGGIQANPTNHTAAIGDPPAAVPCP